MILPKWLFDELREKSFEKGFCEGRKKALLGFTTYIDVRLGFNGSRAITIDEFKALAEEFWNYEKDHSR